jgi:hypothetical protein
LGKFEMGLIKLETGLGKDESNLNKVCATTPRGRGDENRCGISAHTRGVGGVFRESGYNRKIGKQGDAAD